MSKKTYDVEVEIKEITTKKTILKIDAKNQTAARNIAEFRVEGDTKSYAWHDPKKVCTVISSKVVNPGA